MLENEKYEVENIIILYQKLMYRKTMRISPVYGVMRNNKIGLSTLQSLSHTS